MERFLCDFSELKGHVFDHIEYEINGSDTVTFARHGTALFCLEHVSECCEQTYLADITGDINDILNEEILVAEVATNDLTNRLPNEGALLWTFYKLRTRKGEVVFRFIGESNGYYSVDVNCYCL